MNFISKYVDEEVKRLFWFVTIAMGIITAFVPILMLSILGIASIFFDESDCQE